MQQNPLRHFKKNQINTDLEVDQAHKIKQQILDDSTDEFTIFYGTPHIYQQNIDYLEKNHMKVQESSSNNFTTEIGIAWTDNGEDKMQSQMQNPEEERKRGARTSAEKKKEAKTSGETRRTSGEKKRGDNKLEMKRGTGKQY